MILQNEMLVGNVSLHAYAKEDVIVGKGHIRALRLSKTKRVMWILPGRQLTDRREEAVYAATEIDRIHREARRG